MTVADRAELAGAKPLDGTWSGGPQDTSELRRIFGMFATGVTVLTTGGAVPHGMTANSFTSVSLSPPLVLVCVVRDAAMHETILDRKAFGVSVLSSGQEGLARYFADRRRPRGPQEFAPIEWSPGQHTGSPIVSGTLAWLECGLAAVYDGGDHSIFVGEVLDVGYRTGAGALLFYSGKFHRLNVENVYRDV